MKRRRRKRRGKESHDGRMVGVTEAGKWGEEVVSLEVDSLRIIGTRSMFYLWTLFLDHRC